MEIGYKLIRFVLVLPIYIFMFFGVLIDSKGIKEFKSLTKEILWP